MTSQDLYPGPRTYSESERLQAQHALFKTYLAFVLAPLELQTPNLRILDSGTADGYWLADLASHLGPNATLVGTDIAKYDTPATLPSNVSLSLQNVKDPWPAEWASTFDLVHQRLVLSNLAHHATAVQAVARMVDLLKPGGWIQLDESAALEGPFEDSDTPLDRMWKVVGQFMKACGMDPSPGAHVKYVLREAGQGTLGEVQIREVEGKLGCTAPSREVAQAGMTNIMGVMDGVKAALGKIPNAPMTPEEFESLRPGCVEQLEKTGGTTTYVAVWAQKLA